MKQPIRILIIVPALNEEATIQDVILGIRRSLPQADILVVNDGSTDATGPVSKGSGVILLTHPYNMGIGATMQTGFLYALDTGYEMVVQIDGDGQHKPEFLPSMLQPLLEEKCNLVIGSRYLSTGGFQSTLPRKVGITFFSVLIWLFTGKRVTDPTSGFRAMDRKAFELFSKEYPSDYPEVEALVSAHKKGLMFQEVNIDMRHRQGGVSSIGLLSALYYMIKVTLSIAVGFFRRINE